MGSERTPRGRAGARDAAAPASRVSLKALWPDIWELVRPRRGILLVGFLLMIVNRISGLVLPASTKFLIDDVVGKRHFDLLLPLVGGVVTATIIQAATSFGLTQILSKAAQRLIAELRCKVQVHVGRLPVAFYDSNRTGALVSRIMSDVEGVRNLIGTGLVEFVGGLVTALASLAILLRINALMTLMTAGVLISFALVLNRAFAVIRPIFRERGKINAEVTGRLTESLGAVRVVKGYHAEAREASVFAAGAQRLLDNVVKTLTATSSMGLASTLLMGIVGAVVMYFGARQILAGSMTLGEFFTYSMFLGFLVAPVFQIVAIGTQLTESLAGLERTRELLNEAPEDADPNRTVMLSDIRGDIRFDNVRFSYEEEKEVLKGVSFHAPPGTVTALVGSSGSGKSTTIGLIAAFSSPGSGQVLVDDVDLATVRLESYRTRLGVVLQDTFLFDGSIRENVAFGRPDAPTAEIESACEVARVNEFASRFPDGLETVVGERGVRLSGGQKQRVSIARALLADPRILILDEATSSLDSESEALIQAGLTRLMQGRTTFVIAHRLSTIRRADQILVMEGGEIVERGTHETLYAANGRYRDLYDRQHGLEMNLFLAPGEGDPPPADPGGAPPRRRAADPNPLGLMSGRS